MTNAILPRVLAIVSRVAGPGRTPWGAGPETGLGEPGYWLDSVDMLEVVLACEHEFGIVLSDPADLTRKTLATVGSLAELIGRKIR
jgi:acyl carrier protein